MKDRCKEVFRSGSPRQCQLKEKHDGPCIHSGIARDAHGNHCGKFTYRWNFKDK